MTLLTVIVSAVVLLKFGLSGTTGMFFVMALAGMVCVALCASGQFITDLKAGYWIGSTPSAQEKVKFIGVVAAAITAGLTRHSNSERLRLETCARCSSRRRPLP
jgi:uncharacterized oligopeptide transporter (OPT) family protein